MINVFVVILVVLSLKQSQHSNSKRSISVILIPQNSVQNKCIVMSQVTLQLDDSNILEAA